MRTLEKKTQKAAENFVLDYDFMREGYTVIWHLVSKWCTINQADEEEVIFSITPYFSVVNKKVKWCVNVFTVEFNDIVYTGSCESIQDAMYSAVSKLVDIVGFVPSVDKFLEMADDLGLSL